MAEDTSIFQEIDESLRVDNMEKFLRRYGKLVIAACVGIVLATAASVYWKSYVQKSNMAQTDKLLDAGELIESGKNEDARKKLEEVTQAKGGVATLSRMVLAENLISQGQAEKAEKAFTEIAGDKNAEPALRDLSAINASIISHNHHLPDDNNNTEALKNLYYSNSPYSAIAGELYALRVEKSGNGKEARDIFAEISNNPSLSKSQRMQAKELQDTIKESR